MEYETALAAAMKALGRFAKRLGRRVNLTLWSGAMPQIDRSETSISRDLFADAMHAICSFMSS